ncbi:DUF3152 domain-containing protein [Micromonospora craniellae]|uniref:DUF3152 domain-containing protein n=2 Tax=Micromonospora craniellae TaxID=2294034 RepID=A0A372G6J9_9ACTN|nr:DUF3152 domain-containing protein [Micromonospora craniellae]QOC90213.1 DUF3152 domain-containing protein [Micromonospora craniellae]RFS48399.1 DUF3152 domain-containing protein [Micromonospora craniellae]
MRSPAGRRGSRFTGRHSHSLEPVTTTRRRRAVLLRLAVLVVAVGAGAALVTGATRTPAGSADEVTAVTSPPVALSSPVPSTSPGSPSVVVPSPVPVLRESGPVPSSGPGRFDYDDRTGPVLGAAGDARRYRVAVESGAGVDAGEFALAVRAALAGPGSWVDSGRLRLRQVETASRYDFTVYLATATTAGRMCAAGGVDIRIGGRPYTSCRAPGKVIINLDRWRQSVPHYVEAEVPLSLYRAYVINHEVGHELGNRHERCPGRGEPAPVMMQQTLFLKGCVANPWPYLDGKRYAGPPL